MAQFQPAVPPQNSSRVVHARVGRLGRTEVRRRLLDAAVDVFADHGFASSTLDDVAAAAGFTKGAVYSNFTSKDELFFALMDDQITQRLQLVRGALATIEGHNLDTALRQAGALLSQASITTRQWQILFLEFWARAVRDDTLRVSFIAHRRALRAVITEWIEAAYPDIGKASNMSVDEFTTLVLAISNGLAIERLADPESVPPDLFGKMLTSVARDPASGGLPGTEAGLRS